MNIGEFIQVTKGFTKAPHNRHIQSIVYNDSRFVRPNDFFWVRDQKGFNNRVATAIKKGAIGIIAANNLRGKIKEQKNISYIYVDRSMVFKYAQYNRNLIKVPVVGVTGSAGKTTVKNMITQILRSQGKVMSTYATMNAVYSAPYNTMKLNSSHKYGVFEMGMKGLGQIRIMGSYYQPTIGIITNIGDAHIGKLGNSVNNIIKAKQEIIGTIRKNGYLILNADNQYTSKLNLSGFKGKKILYFGIKNNADIKASKIRYKARSTSFKVTYLGKTYDFTVAAIGEHNVYNALAAIAAAFILNVPYPNIKSKLATFRNAGMRTQILKGINNSTIISDAFNANPTAAIEGIRSLKLISNKNPAFAVIGNMGELGSHTVDGHKKVGRKAADLGVNVIGVGTFGQHVVAGAKQSKNNIIAQHLPDKKSAYNYLKKVLKPNVHAYFKASRTFKMETLIRQLKYKKA
ncbi:UDP-N-acetylmuramoyl-tripeptide--D-alanyl-D-alanine ligase [Desulfuribacillus alkaliarsenatis]|uniref:UDP-N-acetylmuramoyl-tripeptide--D-alanyl-D-alanine ligase n=1 Tax=Desulfuribacillus alkaliarsenatis TaxID=766136 RepID=A0A1E5G6A6_9FIRM|nr:UDP-N-acetylmuramoyl-tripeptide--D-alanyl-D-alanine ligase [Desulfuribacillus alkaliarsenatis]OEF98728.1 hypothetical protein BHF68_03455 [Desulfuribacillus alkaliarsenatis]